MQRSRRRFIKYSAIGGGAACAGAWYWLATSQQRAARWLRVILNDSRRKILPPPSSPDLSSWSENNVSLCWIGHSTILIDFYGVRILTDPAFGSRIGVSLGIGTAGPKRYVAPALNVTDLPPIDLLLLSHAHMDHMDLPSLRKLRNSAVTITAKETSDILSPIRLGKLTELGWNDRETVKTAHGDLVVEAIEVKHWGQRWPNDRQRGYNGYILRREDRAILFAGDTAHTPVFANLKNRGPFDLALMPIGAYQPWIWNHCNPEQAVELANMAGARYIAPIHHQTFRLSKEPMNEPIERFQTALQSEPERIAFKQIGDTFICPKT